MIIQHSGVDGYLPPPTHTHLQESIPVGCVPRAFLVPGGGGMNMSEHVWNLQQIAMIMGRSSSSPLFRHTAAPVSRPPWRQTAPCGWILLEADSNPLQRRTPLWIEWQTRVKILPCPKLRLRAVINQPRRQRSQGNMYLLFYFLKFLNV